MINTESETNSLDYKIVVAGQQLLDLPEDLYIPPEAMKVILEVFEGPLDLLLYLIRKHNIDILNIPIAEITAQYIKYIELMQDFKLELAAEYLEMAALLAEIKSRMLIPKEPEAEEEEECPKAALIRRLQEYEKIKFAADEIDKFPRVERDLFAAEVKCQDKNVNKIHPTVTLDELLSALQHILVRADLNDAHKISKEPLSVRDRMSKILSSLQVDKFTEFSSFFVKKEGKLGVVVTLLAILELAKDRVIEIMQTEEFSPIYVRIAADD